MDFNFLLSLGFQALLCMKTVDVVKLGVGEMGSKRMDGTKWETWNGISACGCSIQFIGKYQSEAAWKRQGWVGCPSSREDITHEDVNLRSLRIMKG